MPKHSFSIEGAVGNESEGYYDGPMPRKGTYTGKLKILQVGSIANGDNRGKPRLKILVEITGPKNAKNIKGGSCIGAGVWGGLNVVEQGVPYVNQFLNALTDGSDRQKRAIQTAFWDKGVTTDEDGHIRKLGNVVINSPSGSKEIVIVVNHKPYGGEMRPQISRYLIADSTKRATTDDEDEDVDDAADEDDPDLDDEEEDEDEDDDDEEEDDEGDDPPF